MVSGKFQGPQEAPPGVVWGGLGPRVTCSHGSVMLHLLGHQCPSVLLPGDGETYDACQTVLIITCDHIFLSFCPFVYQFSAFFLSWFQILSRISGFPLDNSILFSGIGKKTKQKIDAVPQTFGTCYAFWVLLGSTCDCEILPRQVAC